MGSWVRARARVKSFNLEPLTRARARTQDPIHSEDPFQRKLCLWSILVHPIPSCPYPQHLVSHDVPRQSISKHLVGSGLGARRSSPIAAMVSNGLQVASSLSTQ